MFVCIFKNKRQTFVPFYFMFVTLHDASFCCCCVGGAEATLFYWAGSVCSSFSAEAHAILQALRWSRQHQQDFHFSFLLFYSRSVISSISLSLADLEGTIFSLLYYQVAMGPGHSFFPMNDTTDESARRGALLLPSTVPCSLFYLFHPLFSFLRPETYCSGSDLGIKFGRSLVSIPTLAGAQNARECACTCDVSRTQLELKHFKHAAPLGRTRFYVNFVVQSHFSHCSPAFKQSLLRAMHWRAYTVRYKHCFRMLLI